MTLRSLLLAGTVLPFTIGYPALASDRTPLPAPPLLLAQADAACPEGQECPPPLEGTEQPTTAPDQAPQPPVEAAPPEIVEEPPPAIQEAPPDIIEEAPPEQAPPEPEAETPPTQEALPPDAPPQPDAEPLPPEGVIIEETPPQEPPPPDMETTTPPDQPPAPDAETETPPEQPPAPDVETISPPEQVPPGAEAPMPPVESTTEQQLEAQGDEEEADRVRTLRDRMLQQLEGTRDASGERRERRDRRRGYDRRDDGNVVERRGGDVIIDLGGGNIYVEPDVPDDADRLLYGAENVEVIQLEEGRTRTIVYRENGVQIITNRDRYGEIIRRVKRLPDGRDIVLIDNTFEGRYDADRRRILRDVPPPVVGIPEDRYIVDLGGASYDDIRGALLAPPVQRLERRYTLDEVLRNEPVRAYSPRIDLDTITFEFGSSTIGNDQMRSIFELGRALEDVLRERPDEVYLIEGHTDLVGSNYDNLILSDRRADAVAVALSQNFEIPPENLITEGYGEEYPKVMTDGPERRNRRATVRRVTELLQAEAQ